MHFTVLIFNLLKKDFWSSHISEMVDSTTNLWELSKKKMEKIA